MNVCLTAPVFDATGYGEFSRHFAAGLHKAGIQTCVEMLTLEKDRAELGEVGKVCTELTRKKLKPDVNVIAMVPTLFKQSLKPGCKNVGFTMFEATRIPDSWVPCCNQMDAIIVPSTWCAQVFAASGVVVPIHVVPLGVENFAESKRESNGDFRFYSAFQWSERKNPTGLIRAYLSAFSGHEDTTLVLKTRGRDYSEPEKAKVQQAIQQIVASMHPKKSHPKIRIISDLIGSMADLHLQNDCYVSAHRSEGWGMPIMDAMMHGKPVIATVFSGNMDFMDHTNSLPVKYTMTPVFNMDWLRAWYTCDMLWAEPDMGDLMAKMRWVYEHRDEAAELGREARKHVLTNFNWEKCTQKLIAALEKVVG